MPTEFDPDVHASRTHSEAKRIGGILQRLHQSMQHDQVVQSTTDDLRHSLQVDRVVLYYFYRQWEGQVTFESLSDTRFSIYGSTGPDECFNGDYAQMYLEGRVRAIEDIETASIEPCHRDFLRYMNVRANLVVPILPDGQLWGLLVAHHCQQPKAWTLEEIEQMCVGAKTLAAASSIRAN